MWLFVLACVAPAFGVSFVGTWVMRRMAPVWGLVDQPNARKVHVTPTPLGGGVGIWLGVTVTLATAQLIAWLLLKADSIPDFLPAELSQHLEGVVYRADKLWAILAAGTVLAVMGLLDDRRNLPWQPRLLVQLMIAISLAAGGVSATVFVPAPWVGSILTVCWILVLINSFNFLDNMDALSSGIGLIVSMMFAVTMLTATSEPHWFVAGVLLVLAGAIGGFLCFNRPPASIFMGDSGSYFIGLIIATMTVLGTFYEESSGGSRHVILAPLCILAVPLYDTASVVLIRLREGRSPFHPDKKHFSHRLVELGLRPTSAVLTVHLTTLTTGLAGLLLFHVESWTEALVILAIVSCVLAIIAILETAGRQAVRRASRDNDNRDESH